MNSTKVVNNFVAKIRADHRQAIVEALKQVDSNDDTKDLITDTISVLEEDIEVYRQMGEIKK